MLYPQRRICYVSMVEADANAKYDALHKAAPFHDGTFTRWSATRNRQTPYHYRDGVTLWVAQTDLTPHDHFLGGARDCEECSGGGVEDGEEDDGGDR